MGGACGQHNSEVLTRSWWENMKERDLGVDERMWIGCIWLNVGTSSLLL
jgi:hypothetical protein